jgi:hypothetical protein
MRLISPPESRSKSGMSGWLHNLPVPVMALATFGFTYLLAAAIFAGITLVATGERAKPVAPSVNSRQ